MVSMEQRIVKIFVGYRGHHLKGLSCSCHIKTNSCLEQEKYNFLKTQEN
jgi:hypothetical protein